MPLEELEQLIQELESSPDENVREAILDALLPFLDFHREAFQRVIDILNRHGGQKIVAQMLQDPLLATALHGYGIVPEGAPEVPVSAPAPVTKLIPVEELVAKASMQNRKWVPLVHRSAVPEHELMNIQLFEDEVLVCSANQRTFVFKNRCPQQGHTLSEATVDEWILTCPCHGLRFDLRTGRCEEKPDLRLEMLTVNVDNDLVKVGL